MQSCPADCKAHGQSAGPIRDTVMFADHRPTLEFPGGRRTANVVKKAADYGVPVIEEATWRAAMLTQAD